MSAEDRLTFFDLAINIARNTGSWDGAEDFARKLAEALGIIFQPFPRKRNEFVDEVWKARPGAVRYDTPVMRMSSWGCRGCGALVGGGQAHACPPKQAVVRTWDDDSVQFPRLLAEIKAEGMGHEQQKHICASMDISREQLQELLDRAEEAFERMKEKP